MPKWLLGAIYSTIILTGVIFTVWFVAEGWHDHDSARAAPVIGALLVAIGWMVTSENTIQNSARDHTIRVLLDYQSDESVKLWKTIRTFVPRPTALKLPGESDGYGEPDHEVFQAVDKQLDAYDFIALGVRFGVYNDSMLESALRPNFFDLYNLAGNYITYTRTLTGDQEVWAEFTSLCLNWRASSPVPGESWIRRALRIAWTRLGYGAGFLGRS
jgi:hypothetical protein